jgi:leucyl aminopeptidase
MLNLEIEVSNKLNSKHKTTIIPVLSTHQKKLFNYLKNYLEVDNQHNKKIIDELQDKFKLNQDTQVSLIIELNGVVYHIILIGISITLEEQKLLKLTKNNLEKNKNCGLLLDKLRNKGAEMFLDIDNNKLDSLNMGMISNLSDDINGMVNTALLEGFLLASYKFNKYKTNKKSKSKLKFANLVFPKIMKPKLKNIEKDVVKLRIRMRSVFFARDLVNEPGNKLYSTKFIEVVKNFVKLHNIPVKITVWDTNKLQKEGMNLLDSVGKGSLPERGSKLLFIEYKTSQRNNPDYVLIGKGVTFDTGGITMKPGHKMHEMKNDMGGAAAVVAFILGYAKFGGSQKIIGLIPLSENNIGKGATSPGDVITSHSGKTVEIIDTDAEGRLLLADCLSYTSKKYPKSKVIDIATLTGSQENLACKQFSNVISRHPELSDNIVKSGNFIQELVVELPYMEKFKKFLKSDVADLGNIAAKCNSELMTSSVFLGQFIDPKVEWAHIDIAGTVGNLGNDVKYVPGMSSGVGVRLLFNLIE